MGLVHGACWHVANDKENRTQAQDTSTGTQDTNTGTQDTSTGTLEYKYRNTGHKYLLVHEGGQGKAVEGLHAGVVHPLSVLYFT